jgi:hypothetical protein
MVPNLWFCTGKILHRRSRSADLTVHLHSKGRQQLKFSALALGLVNIVLRTAVFGGSSCVRDTGLISTRVARYSWLPLEIDGRRRRTLVQVRITKRRFQYIVPTDYFWGYVLLECILYLPLCLNELPLVTTLLTKVARQMLAKSRHLQSNHRHMKTGAMREISMFHLIN